jgi:cytochrome c oxidase subunit IV
VRQLVRWRRDWRFIRDILAFVIGGAGLIVEMTHGFANPNLALIYASLMGIPIFFQPHNTSDNGAPDP